MLIKRINCIFSSDIVENEVEMTKFFLLCLLVLTYGIASSDTHKIRVQSKSEIIFQAKCASCHGKYGMGTTKVPNATKLNTFGKTPYVFLKNLIRNGNTNNHPSFKKSLLTDIQVYELVRYIRMFDSSAQTR